MTLICDGDSWVFGSEIVCPDIQSKFDSKTHPGVYDYLENNDFYRIPKIFPTHLGKLMNSDVINLSWPADDNNTILNRIITFITSEYIAKGKSVEELFVIVGWSGPERNSFWYKDDDRSEHFRIWPYDSNYQIKAQKEFWKMYVTYLWNPEEFIPRHVMNVLQFQNFCKTNNIKWLCFNSFYRSSLEFLSEWEDLSIDNELNKIKKGGVNYYDSTSETRLVFPYDYKPVWNTIDDIRFYKKNYSKNTFRSFIDSKNEEPIYAGWHPSPKSHELWANEIFEYINTNKLI